MESFDELLTNLLTHCRDNVLDGLRTNQRYADYKQEQADKRAKLEAISPEAEKLLEEYLEASVIIHAMEYNHVLMCGLTFSAALRNRFDSSTPEHQAFVKEYLS